MILETYLLHPFTILFIREKHSSESPWIIYSYYLTFLSQRASQDCI